MSNPCIITVAITGALPTKLDTPAVPVTPSEQIESTHEAYEIGASLVHIHVRNQDQTPSSDPDKYHEVQQGVSKHCPGMIIQFSTGGRGRDQSLRAGMLHHRPDMASLATGSVNSPRGIYENPADFVEGLAAEMQRYKVKPEIEVFDAAMLYNAANLVKKGLLDPPVHLRADIGGRSCFHDELPRTESVCPLCFLCFIFSSVILLIFCDPLCIVIIMHYAPSSTLVYKH